MEHEEALRLAQWEHQMMTRGWLAGQTTGLSFWKLAKAGASSMIGQRGPNCCRRAGGAAYVATDDDFTPEARLS